MKYIIDRIIDDKAVVECESGEMLTIPSALLKDAKEGDAITLTIEGKTEQAKADTHSIFEKLRNKSKSED